MRCTVATTNGSAERFIAGSILNMKNQVTSASSATAMVIMIASSLAKIDLRIVAADEAISRAADGADETRALRVVAELLPQPADQHVDGAVVRVPVDAASLVHDAVARERAAAVAHQEAEELELGAGEIELAAVESRGARRPVHFERSSLEHLVRRGDATPQQIGRASC